MAVTPEDLLPTPAGYASPGQVASVRAHAQLLNAQAQPEQIRSPVQGYAAITKALMGGLEETEANRQEAMGRAAAALTSGAAMTGQGDLIGLGMQKAGGP